MKRAACPQGVIFETRTGAYTSNPHGEYTWQQKDARGPLHTQRETDGGGGERGFHAHKTQNHAIVVGAFEV